MFMKRNKSEMKTLTICGSMRFEKEMTNIALELETKHGFNVLQCTYNFGNVALTAEEINKISAAHLNKIDISDGIYVVDIDGYIGEAVRTEILYAQSKCKTIIYHSEFTNNL